MGENIDLEGVNDVSVFQWFRSCRRGGACTG